MFKRFRHSSLFFWSLEILVLATLIFMLSQINFLFAPIATFISTLFGPILIAGFSYYLFNPLVKLLEKMHISRNWGIALVFVVFFGGLVIIVAEIVPNLVTQITQMVTNLPALVKQIQNWAEQASKNSWVRQLGLEDYLSELKVDPNTILKTVLGSASGLTGAISSVISVVFGAITIPVMLFYFLKDGHRLIPNIQKMLPDRYNDQAAELMVKMSDTISHYIAGQAIECLFVGTFTFIGYLIIGMPYAFLLGFIAGLTTIIPYLGPYLGIAPALIVAATISVPKMILVAIVVIIVQQIDGNFIYPNVIGRSLDIHPLTIIIILLAAGNLYGILGTILAVPCYAVIKTVIQYLLNIRHLRQKTVKA